MQTASSFYVILDVIVFLVVAVIIANTLLMSVFKRIREMGILSARGMKGRHITQMLMLEAAALGLAGIVVVLADEPTTNLDSANGQQAMEIMERLNKETGTAFVYATHDPRVVAFARRGVKLQDGGIVDDGSASGRATAA